MAAPAVLKQNKCQFTSYIKIFWQNKTYIAFSWILKKKMEDLLSL